MRKVWQVVPATDAQPSRLFAGAERAGLLSSDDHGQTWSGFDGLNRHPTGDNWQPGNGGLCLHTIFPEYGQCVHKAKIHPQKPGVSYQQNHCGVYRSDDGGENWADISDGLPSRFGFPLALHAVRSDETGTLLLSVLPEADCPSGPGVYQWDPAGGGEPSRLDPERSWGMRWLEESGVFDVYPTALFSPDGSARYAPPVLDSSFEPAISKKGFEAWEVIENTQGRAVVREPEGDWREILRVDAAELLWDPLSGETLLIAAQDGRLYAASAPDFIPRVMGDLGGSVDQGIWVP